MCGNSWWCCYKTVVRFHATTNHVENLAWSRLVFQSNWKTKFGSNSLIAKIFMRLHCLRYSLKNTKTCLVWFRIGKPCKQTAWSVLHIL